MKELRKSPYKDLANLYHYWISVCPRIFSQLLSRPSWEISSKMEVEELKIQRAHHYTVLYHFIQQCPGIEVKG